ncbi:DNA-binding response regulator, partial [Streptococcus suis]
KNILCLVIQIRKLFYFGLKLRVKSAYKTNTLC